MDLFLRWNRRCSVRIKCTIFTKTWSIFHALAYRSSATNPDQWFSGKSHKDRNVDEASIFREYFFVVDASFHPMLRSTPRCGGAFSSSLDVFGMNPLLLWHQHVFRFTQSLFTLTQLSPCFFPTFYLARLLARPAPITLSRPDRLQIKMFKYRFCWCSRGNGISGPFLWSACVCEWPCTRVRVYMRWCV